MTAPSVAIVGGGIAGLAAAWELEPQSRVGELSVDLYEGSGRFGGPLRTDRTSGLVLEGGPDSFLTGRPDAVELCVELGLSKELLPVRPSARSAFIYRDGRLHRIPGILDPRPSGAARALLASRLLHPAGRARTLLGLGVTLIRPLPTGDAVAAGPALRARFGQEAMDWLIEPLVSGMHPAPIDALSFAEIRRILPARWTAAGPAAPSRSPHRSSRPVRTGNQRPVPGPFVALRTGMEQLPEAVQVRLAGTRLHARKQVSQIVRTGDRCEIRFEQGGSTVADAVLLAVPPTAASRLISDVAPEASAELSSVRMADTVVVGMVFDRSDIPGRLDGSGVLVPRRTNLPISAITWLSSKWERPDPTGRAFALRVFLRMPPDLATDAREEECVGRALEGLTPTMGIRVHPWHTVVFRHPRALAWYDIEHAARVARIRSVLSSWDRLEVAGGAYDGIGIPDAIRSGREAARRLATAVRAPSSDRRLTPRQVGALAVPGS